MSQSLINIIPSYIISEIISIQKKILWQNSDPKIRHETLCTQYKEGVLKNVDIAKKIISLLCSWVRRLHGDFFYEWQIIPFCPIKKSFLAILLDFILMWHLRNVM